MYLKHALATVHNDHHDTNLVKGDTNDLAVHEGRYKLALAGLVINYFIIRSSCGKGEGTQDVHDEVYPDELHRVQHRLGLRAVADDDDDEYAQVAGDLELQEALHVHVDVTAPHDRLHAGAEV